MRSLEYLKDVLEDAFIRMVTAHFEAQSSNAFSA